MRSKTLELPIGARRSDAYYPNYLTLALALTHTLIGKMGTPSSVWARVRVKVRVRLAPQRPLMHPHGLMSDSIKELTAEICAFRDARDWQQFHAPKELAVAICAEAGELLQHFVWAILRAVSTARP